MPVSPIERNESTEPNAGAFIFGFEFLEADAPPRELEWEEVAGSVACPERGGWRWLHFNRLAAETRDWLESVSGLDETIIEALLQSETRPRCVSYNDGVLLNLRGINHNPGAEPEDMISVRVWAAKRLVISMRSYPVKAIHEVRVRVAKEGATSPGSLLVDIASSLVDYIDPVIVQLKEDADEYEERMLTAGGRISPSDLAEFRQTILVLRRYIGPQREAMDQLQKLSQPLVGPDHSMIIRETGDRMMRISEELDTVRDRAAVLQDQVVGQRAEVLNQRLLVLSIISALFLPLTFLTGLLGMNVEGIPYAKEPWAFGAVVLITIVLSAGVLIYLRNKRWL